MKRLFILFILTFLFSCSSKKNVLYLQDTKLESEFLNEYSEYKIKVDDILKVDIEFQTPDISSFSKSEPNFTNANTKEMLLFNGYMVNSDGMISIPVVGKLYVLNNTISEVRDLIYNKLTNQGILLDPFVDIKILNLYFTVLGEVNRPGRYDFIENNFNILEAIGSAGDLTITGNRDDIKLIREIDNVTRVFNIDLTNSDFINSPFFQVRSGDVIIVNPNRTKVKSAGIIGNSGTLLSLLSFILSSIIVINN